MRISVGSDIAKEIHWVTAIDADGVVQIDRKLLNTPADIAALADELAALHGTVRIGLDVIGGIAGLAEAMLAAAGFALVHVPDIAVNRARQGTVGGENKSDPRDARTTADQLRTRSDLRAIEPATELDLEIRLLVGRRGDIVQAQTQRLSRMRDLLVGMFPGLEACLDLKTKGPLYLLTRFVTPAELRSAGKKRLLRHLQAAGGLPKVEDLADRVLAVAAEQTVTVPAERMTARLIRELAAEGLASRTRLIELDRELEALLQRHPDAALIRSLPGMGAVLTAELIAEAGNLARFRSADALASAAGMAPVPATIRPNPLPATAQWRQQEPQARLLPVGLLLPRARRQPDLLRTQATRGKAPHQAVIALARRRVNVLWAIVHSRTPFQPRFKTAA